jgi:hypothetical protein
VVEGLASSIFLQNLNVELKFSEVYRGLEFRSKPKLVEGEPDDPGSTFGLK